MGSFFLGFILIINLMVSIIAETDDYEMTKKSIKPSLVALSLKTCLNVCFGKKQRCVFKKDQDLVQCAREDDDCRDSFYNKQYRSLRLLLGKNQNFKKS